MSAWFDKLVARLDAPQVINDSKTPSGRVHVGSLRGVLIHDTLRRALADKGVAATFLYGSDDYDPLDGLPPDADPLKPHLGRPLCRTPAPPGSQASDFADAHISDFLALFPALGVEAEPYRTRDMYRSGRFNEAIDALLSRADVVARIYAEVSGAQRPAGWLPFQALCENCGRIGTTQALSYDGKTVAYVCRKDLVSWAQGCGHEGRVAPFDGGGKLPWKLEWAAKWHVLGVTIEGAGKDHCTRGGSRDVAERCLREIFGGRPPLNVPYEFFLVAGAKMSSSKGVGAAAREIANLLPPEVLRFLMLRTPPRKTVNFSTDLEQLVKLFNDYDALVADAEPAPEALRLRRAIAIDKPASGRFRPARFQLLAALAQLPHLDPAAEIARRAESDPEGGLDARETADLQAKLRAAKYWLAHFAADEDRLELQDTLPASAHNLSAAQKAFIARLAKDLPQEPMDEDRWQAFLFDAARTTPLPAADAFVALYRVLFNRDRGPRGGALLAFLDRDFLQRRFGEVPSSLPDLWRETAVAFAAGEQWVQRHAEKLGAVVLQALGYPQTPSVVEALATMKDGKRHVLRVAAPDDPEGVVEKLADVVEAASGVRAAIKPARMPPS